MSKEKKPKSRQSVKLALAAIAAAGSLSLAVYQYGQTRPTSIVGRLGRSSIPSRPSLRQPHFIEADDGRQLLWAKGPHDVETGQWFDVTGSPLNSDGYQFGIGKDTIPAIDQPMFVAIDERKKLLEHGISSKTEIIGYVHNGEAKAYPVQIMNRHELVNDVVGGKPVTVGW